MKELEKKLVNINNRNRMLYMPKISAKYAYDLMDKNSGINPLDIIFGSKPVVICDTRKQAGLAVTEADKYRRLVSLLREVNKDQREKGQFDLYVGYPFVKGRLAGENFDVRAPLALFPVEVVREADRIILSIDDTKDAVYNLNLVLAHQKFNNLNRPLPNGVIEDYLMHTEYWLLIILKE